MEEPPTDHVIDLTLDFDNDEVSEVPCNESTGPTDFIKKEPEEPVTFSDEISEFSQEVEREADSQVVQSIEEGPSASTVERVIPRVTPQAISEEAAVVEDGALAGTVAQASVPTDIPADIPAAFIPPRLIATRPLSREELIARDQELENQLRNGIAEFHASLNINVLVPAARETPQLSLAPEDGDTSWMLQAGEDEDAKEAEAAAEFAKHKKLYEQKKRREEATVEDDIEFAAAEAAEKRRLKRAKKIEVRMQQQVDRKSPASTDDEEMFFPERPPTIKHAGRKLSPEDDDNDVDPEPRLVKKPKISQPRNKDKLTAQEIRESMKGGLEAGLAKEKKKSGRKPRKPTEKAPKKSSPKSKAAKDKDEAGKVTKKRGRPRKGPIFSNIASLTNSNIIKDAQANAAKRDMPTFSAKDKSKALQELISSIPIAERHMVSSDKQAILDATRKFNGRGVVKSDERGGWILKGMTSSLFNHQVLGAGFMRDRENGNSKPFGGMVCDEMGFGKTITTLASILDGKAEPGNPNKTTLIIATPSLVTQWMDEIEKHFKPGIFGKVLRYHSGAKLFSNDPLGDLKAYDIILTTYSEVRQSYPVYRPPMHLSTEATKNEWWAEHFRNTVGPLHNIRFRRIVCDEAQALKNRMSLTSIAVRALHGHYKWIISGTPIQNYIEELYPYFNFLKVPHTGDFTTFVNNYCGSRTDRSLVDMERINNILRAIMLRRTHVDTLFNAPIVKLPGIEYDTVMLDFNEVERAIYKLIKSKFVNMINNYSKTGSIETHYQNILSMMLKLRMLTGHILLVQQSLKELMVAADVEALWRLTAKEVEHSGDKPNTHSLLQLRQMFKERARARKKPVAGNVSPEPSPGAEEKGEEMAAGGSFGLTFKFRKFLRALKESKVWVELHSRSVSNESCSWIARTDAP
jgi:SNF2 family DNA or RNA helicase